MKTRYMLNLEKYDPDSRYFIVADVKGKCYKSIGEVYLRTPVPDGSSIFKIADKFHPIVDKEFQKLVDSRYGVQLLENPGFEDANDPMTGWSAGRRSPLTATVVKEARKDIHSGETAVKLVDVPDKKTGYISCTKAVNVKPGEIVRSGIWVKGKGKIYIGLFPATNGKRLRLKNSSTINLNDQWQKLSWAYTVTEGIDQVTFLILLCYEGSADYTGHHAIVDDAYLKLFKK